MTCYTVRDNEHYVKGVEFSVFLSIEPGYPRLPPDTVGGLHNPRRWIKVVQSPGATVASFCNFIDTICKDIEENGHNGFDDHRIFLWDNLNSHLSHYVTQTVEGREGPRHFSCVARPPYQPKYGPIEYKICDIVQAIKLRSSKKLDDGSLGG